MINAKEARKLALEQLLFIDREEIIERAIKTIDYYVKREAFNNRFEVFVGLYKFSFWRAILPNVDDELIDYNKYIWGEQVKAILREENYDIKSAYNGIIIRW